MNTYLTGFKLFSGIESLCFGQKKLQQRAKLKERNVSYLLSISMIGNIEER